MAGAAALFGKLPAHGDFVARGLDAGTRDALDAWLSAEMADARAAFDDDFASRFDIAPGWCFARPDALGSWSAGALAPSVDAVGRRFPLLVSASAGDAAAAGGMALACADAIHAALCGGWDADRLHATLARLTPLAAPPAIPGWWIADVGGAVVERIAGERPAGLLRTMLAEREKA